jgi:phage/plasmid-associated DNA primase
MSSLTIRPRTNREVFIKDRDEEIVDAINMYFDYVNDSSGSLEISSKKCLIYDYDCDRVVIVFPLIPSVDMRRFVDRCRWISSFKYIGTDVYGAESRILLPSSCYPHDDVTSNISKFLGISLINDCMIQDVTIIRALGMNSLILARTMSKRRAMTYRQDEYNNCVIRLENDSQLLELSEGDYKDIRNDRIKRKVEVLNDFTKIGSSCDNAISDVLFEMMVDDAVFCDKDWYHFVDGRWTRDNGKVWRMLSHTLPSVISSSGVLEEDTEQMVREHLGSAAVRSRITKDISMKLMDSDFVDKMNSKKDIIGMKNGSFLLDEMRVRTTLPSDYISLSCGVGYSSHAEGDAIELMGILRQIFPKESVRRFFIRSCASMLEGYNEHKVFYVWWGTGNNAKTLLQRFVSTTFGEYSACLSTSLITGKRSKSSEATPDMYYAKNKLVVFLQEPNPDEKIQVGRIKELTGNDRIYIRDLFKSGSTMEFKAKLVIVTNNQLDAPGMDAAFMRRIITIPFESTFSETMSENVEGYQFPIDTRMESKILGYREVFMRIILREYEIFKKNGLDVPRYIKSVTSKYIMLNNYTLKYIDTYVYEDEESSMSLIDIYEKFKEWFWSSYPQRKMPTIESLSNELRNKNYKNVDGIIVGVNII